LNVDVSRAFDDDISTFGAAAGSERHDSGEHDGLFDHCVPLGIHDRKAKLVPPFARQAVASIP
jgi:hypothetical protein